MLFISIVPSISYLLICKVSWSWCIVSWFECVILSLIDLLEIIFCPLILYEAVNEADILDRLNEKKSYRMLSILDTNLI